MSSDDFNTISARRGERAREIEVLRQHYRQHRDALQRMIADAPTEHLATEYQRLVGEIDRALGKLSELEGIAAPEAAARPQREERPIAGAVTEPGMRPLVVAPGAMRDELADAPTIPPAPHEAGLRLPLIVGVAVIALALIGWLIWRASGDRNKPSIVEEQTATTSAAPVVSTADDTIEPASTPQSRVLTAAPASQDYGEIRKGTRATRQFEISNKTEQPISLQVARSACRCLFYEHAPVVPPHGKENLTVTIDAARAKAGELRETIRVQSKSSPAVGTTVDVIATIR
ncbi:MAG: DUF1573 domain-containing protein [Acidobacteriota bacterium]|nr:DUF1573 domain-containing protein [Acidobacteriota bacterium]